MQLNPTEDPGSDALLGSLLTEAMLLNPTDDPGSNTLLGSLFTDGGSLFIEKDPMLPPYRGGGS
jgi:hypothetical protein